MLIIAMNSASLLAQDDGTKTVHQFFRLQTEKIQQRTNHILADESSWTDKRESYRQQLFEMLGLAPDRERTPLNAVTTGTIDHPEFLVKRVHFQSSPGLYVTGNLYLPKGSVEPKPAVLYVCGHSRVAKDGISFGNKTAYQHHGIWLARNGYVCLIIDSLQLGEIEGLHHGTYNLGMWWWVARGYTPAGVEAWNCIRALDYLESLPEVDPKRLGVTGRSGGGAYSWWVSALDDRIQCSIPVAGITNLRNYVIDGCVEGHCDCMFHVNTYQWDFGMIPALVSPRPLLIANTDNDTIFPLDGVVDIYQQTVLRYKSPKLRDQLGLNITFGPHKDTPDLQAHAFSWINRHLGHHEKVVQLDQVETLFTPEQLRVFTSLPNDSINRSIYDTFVPKSVPPVVPSTAIDWEQLLKSWQTALNDKVFRGWSIPEQTPSLQRIASSNNPTGDWLLESFSFRSDDPFDIPVYVVRPIKNAASLMKLHIVDEDTWRKLAPILSSTTPLTDSSLEQLMAIHPLRVPLKNEEMHAWIIPRGIGPTKWGKDEREITQIRRRFTLLGMTDDGQRALDVLVGIRALQSQAHWQTQKLHLEVEGANDAASWLLYAMALEPRTNSSIERVILTNITPSHTTGPLFMNVLKYLDVPQSILLAASKVPITIRTNEPTAFSFTLGAAEKWLPKGQIKLETTAP